MFTDVRSTKCVGCADNGGLFKVTKKSKKPIRWLWVASVNEGEGDGSKAGEVYGFAKRGSSFDKGYNNPERGN